MQSRYLLPLLTALTCLGCAKSEPEPAPIDYSHAADFSFTGTLQNTTPITFNNTSPNAKSYSWNFGDGTVFSTDQQPTHTYRKAGIYPVKLTVMSAGGPITQIQSLTLAQADTLAPIFAIIAGEYRLTKVVSYTYNNTTGIRTTTTEACDVPATVSRVTDNVNVALGNPSPQVGGGQLSAAPPTYKYYGFSASLGSTFGYFISFKAGTDSISYNTYRNSMGGGSSTTYYGKKR